MDEARAVITIKDACEPGIGYERQAIEWELGPVGAERDNDFLGAHGIDQAEQPVEICVPVRGHDDEPGYGHGADKPSEAHEDASLAFSGFAQQIDKRAIA